MKVKEDYKIEKNKTDQNDRKKPQNKKENEEYGFDDLGDDSENDRLKAKQSKLMLILRRRNGKREEKNRKRK